MSTVALERSLIMNSYSKYEHYYSALTLWYPL